MVLTKAAPRHLYEGSQSLIKVCKLSKNVVAQFPHTVTKFLIDSFASTCDGALSWPKNVIDARNNTKGNGSVVSVWFRKSNDILE